MLFPSGESARRRAEIREESIERGDTTRKKRNKKKKKKKKNKRKK